MCLVQIKKLAANVSPTGGLLHATASIEAIEPGITVGLQCAAEGGQMPVWMLSFAVRRVNKPNRGSCHITSRAIISNIRPQTTEFGFTSTWRQHRTRRVIGVQFARPHDVLPQRIVQGREQLARRTDPIGER
jgi:hypothetical protein